MMTLTNAWPQPIRPAPVPVCSHCGRLGIWRGLALAGAALASLAVRADVLELKNGQVLNGKYAGGTATTVRFETEAGMQAIETAQAVALTFTMAAPAAPAAAVAPAPAVLTVPAGTTLLVRMVDGVSSADPTGRRFAAALETDLAAADGTVAVKAGTKFLGRVEDSQQARRLAGQSQLDIRLTEMNLGGAAVPIATGPYAQAGARSIGKTARGAAAGAVIGAVVDGGDGAGKGAAIGAVVSGLKKGEAVTIPAGTLLEFQLQQPLTVPR